MTEKRFVRKGYKVWDTWNDEEVYELCYRYEVDDICRIMNRLIKENELIKQENKELQDTIDTICKDFEVAHGMDIRNADWFTAW